MHVHVAADTGRDIGPLAIGSDGGLVLAWMLLVSGTSVSEDVIVDVAVLLDIFCSILLMVRFCAIDGPQI